MDYSVFMILLFSTGRSEYQQYSHRLAIPLLCIRGTVGTVLTYLNYCTYIAIIIIFVVVINLSYQSCGGLKPGNNLLV